MVERSMSAALKDLRSRLKILERRLVRLSGGSSTPVLPIHFDHNYAPDRTGTLPTTESAAMIVVERDIPPAPYPRMLRGQFTAWFSGNTTAGNKTYNAGIQIFAPGTNPPPDSQEHATLVTADTINTARSLNLPFNRLIAADSAVTIRMLQWGSYSGTTTVTDGNGIAFELECV